MSAIQEENLFGEGTSLKQSLVLVERGTDVWENGDKYRDVVCVFLLN